ARDRFRTIGLREPHRRLTAGAGQPANCRECCALWSLPALLRSSNPGTFSGKFRAEAIRSIEDVLYMRQVILAAEHRSQSLQVNVSANTQLGIGLGHSMSDNKAPGCHLQDALGLHLRFIAVERNGMNQRFLAIAESSFQNAHPAGIAIELVADRLVGGFMRQG